MITIRTATTADAENLSRLVNSGYRGESSKRGWTTEADLLGGQRTDAGKIREMIDAPESRIEIGLDGSQTVVACVHLKLEDLETCYLGMLTVSPELQAAGIGKILLAHSEKTAREMGARKIRMTVIEKRTELLAYYERRGYVQTGKTEAFPENDERFGIPKVPGLRFLVLEKRIA